MQQQQPVMFRESLGCSLSITQKGILMPGIYLDRQSVAFMERIVRPEETVLFNLYVYVCIRGRGMVPSPF